MPGGAFDLLEDLKDPPTPDVSFAEYVGSWQISDLERVSLLNFVEGFNAADAREISSASLGAQQEAEDATDGDLAFSLPGGYDQLAEYLAQRVKNFEGCIHLNRHVREIRWSHHAVQAISPDETFTARRTVITVPLGVLVSGGLSVSPRPRQIFDAASQLRMGHAIRFTLRFREPFWKQLPKSPIEDLGFLFSFDELPSVWWTTHPRPSCLLTGWVGGPRSEALAALTPAELASHACSTLARIFSIETARISDLLLECHTHDWSRDPFSLGAYSYVAAGGLNAPQQLSQPVEDTLFFAGEHTDTTANWGTVHAAMRSGLRVAQQILKGMP
jgi:monoamine oxidase